MTRKIFVTATGTNIGKTYISALIVKSMREAGFNCGYFKPVLSGVEELDGKLITSDCNYVLDFAKLPENPNNCVSYYWKEAVSPHLAAKCTREKIEVQKIINDYKKLCEKYEYLLIEGAGGITCPLNLENGNKYLLKDLIKDLEVGIIIVADGGLGTINSTLLTVEYARSNNIPIQGIILNNFDKNNFMHQDNLTQVEYLTGSKVVATVSENQKDIILLEDLFLE